MSGAEVRRGERRRRRQGGWACGTRADVLQASVRPLHLDLFPPEASVESQPTQRMAPGAGPPSSWAPPGLEGPLCSQRKLQWLGSASAPAGTPGRHRQTLVSAQSRPSMPAPPLCPNFASSNFAPKTLLSKGTSDAQAGSPFSVTCPLPCPLHATFTCF